MYVQKLAELRIVRSFIRSAVSARARRHTGRAAFVGEEAGTPKFTPRRRVATRTGLRRVRTRFFDGLFFVASHDGRRAELRFVGSASTRSSKCTLGRRVASTACQDSGEASSNSLFHADDGAR